MTPEWFDRIEGKVDKVAERLNHVDRTLAAQHVSLKHHIKRTDILEKQMGKLQTSRAQFSGVAKFFGALVGFATIAEAAWHLVHG